MMGTRHRVAKVTLGLAAALTVGFTGAQPAAAAAAPTWRMVDLTGVPCVTAQEPRFIYFLVVLDGHWSSPLEVGGKDLPAGTQLHLEVAPIPPGSGDGHSVQTALPMILPPLPPGTYNFAVTTSDGTDTQSDPTTIIVKDRCY